jgi:hypothetical protein
VPVDRNSLPKDPEILQQMLVDLTTQLDQTQRLLSQLLSAKSGTRSEQLSADQLRLFVQELNAPESEGAAEAQKDEDVPPGSTSNSKEDQAQSRRRGRRTLPAHLKRERIEHDLAEEDKHCACCSQDLRPIGEETSERYEYIPAQLLVIEEICGRRIATGAGDRQQNSRPSARASPGKDLQPLWGGDSGPDHGRLDAAIGGVTRSFVCSTEAVRAEFEGGGD